MPPMDPGGDERLGYFVAGGLLVALGWGLGVVVNVLVHLMAGRQGQEFGWVHLTSTLGTYAWAVVGFGIFTGAVGVVLLGLGARSPKGPFVLPGYPY